MCKYMKKALIVLVGLFVCVLFSCNKQVSGDEITYWSNSYYCLVLGAKPSMAELYEIGSNGDYVIQSSSRFNIKEGVVHFDLKITYGDANFQGIINYNEGIFNETKTSLTLKYRSPKNGVLRDGLTLTLNKSSVGPK